MNLGDPDFELIDPTPNVHSLFVHFDKLFFWEKLSCRTAVRWSKRMYSCAGTCSYAGRSGGGFVDIALSEPLLKLRPRKDLIETLLHEMIHAYLFITGRDRDRDGHGPNFKSHMFRINQLAGLNISIYHDFHEEVKQYQTHWWRCNGRCQSRKPFFGIVRRTCNNAPGSHDYWWKEHLRNCGGTFIKIKEPEKKNNVKGPSNAKIISKEPKLTAKTKQPKVISKANGDISKYVKKVESPKSVNSGFPTSRIPPTLVNSSNIINSTGKLVNSKRERSNSVDVVETVRNVWANKKFTGHELTNIHSVEKKVKNIHNTKNNVVPNQKHKIKSKEENTPPAKIKRIDDFFKIAAPNLLKNVYGEDFKVSQTNEQKIIAIPSKNLVDCPICKESMHSEVINKHLDECLNRDVIKTLSKNNSEAKQNTQSPKASDNIDKKILRGMIGTILPIPEFKNKVENSKQPVLSVSPLNKVQKDLITALKQNNIVNTNSSQSSELIMQTNNLSVLDQSSFNVGLSRCNSNIGTDNNVIDLTSLDTIIKPVTEDYFEPPSNIKRRSDSNSELYFNNEDVVKVKAIVKKINFDKHVRKSDNFIVPKEDNSVANVGYLPSFLDDIAREIKIPPLKIKSVADLVPNQNEQKCPCCGEKVAISIMIHLDNCSAFRNNDVSISLEGPSTSFADKTIFIDDDNDNDDGMFDETMTMNATGTKYPCPCCLKMVEETDMNLHLDTCLK